jgi:chromosome segregation ATPase
MAEPRQQGPRVLYERDPPKAESTAPVDVMELLAGLAERTEELAEARAWEKQAEASLRSMTREASSERKAHAEACKQLESDQRDLAAERDEVAAECRELESQLAREREGRSADEAELKRAQHRVAALQRQLQVAWAQLQQDRTEGGQRSWWSRLRP